MSTCSLESIILSADRRSISALRPHLPESYCLEAARLALETSGPVLVATGFYIPSMGLSETDGPPGALAVATALQRLGREVVFVTDRFSQPLLEYIAPSDIQVIEFPIISQEASERYAADLLARINPGLLIAIERCGQTREGHYITCKGSDLDPYNALLDALFSPAIPSIAVGDGGNEIGMGNLAEWIPAVPGLPADPAVTRVDRLIIASVSNWGCYGLVAALSALTGIDLLPDPGQEASRIADMVAFGACDGAVLKRSESVDGFTLSENQAILHQLQGWLAAARVDSLSN